METVPGTVDHVRAVGRAVRREAAAMAGDWARRDAAAWEAPTACRDWTARDVAAHMTDGAERAVVVARAALAGDPVPHYATAERRRRHAAMRALPSEELAARLQRDLDAVFQALDDVPAAILLATVVPLGGGPHTLAQFADQRLMETALHAWDIRVGGDPAATIAPETGAAMLDFVLWRVPRLASPAEARNVAPHYLFELDGPGGGPVELEVSQDRVTATRTSGAGSGPALTMTVEAFIRLIWGRLDLQRELERSAFGAQAPRDEILTLIGLFPGH